MASGIIRGSGRQKIGMIINFVSYCCLGLPLGVTLLYFVFNDIRGKGSILLLATFKSRLIILPSVILIRAVDFSSVVCRNCQ